MRMILIILPVMSQMTSDLFSISYLKTVVPDLYIASLIYYGCKYVLTMFLQVLQNKQHNTLVLAREYAQFSCV